MPPDPAAPPPGQLVLISCPLPHVCGHGAWFPGIVARYVPVNLSCIDMGDIAIPTVVWPVDNWPGDMTCDLLGGDIQGYVPGGGLRRSRLRLAGRAPTSSHVTVSHVGDLGGGIASFEVRHAADTPWRGL